MDSLGNSGISASQPSLSRDQSIKEPSKNHLVITVDGKELVIEVTRIRVRGKEKNITQLDKVELKAIQELFQKICCESQKKSEDVPSTPLTQLRVILNPNQDQEDSTVSLFKTYAPQQEKEKSVIEIVKLKRSHDVSRMALSVLEDSVNLQNMQDEYPDKDLRYSMDPKENRIVREAARDPAPFIGQVGQLGTEKLDKYQTIAMASRSSKAALRYFERQLKNLEPNLERNKDLITNCKRAIERHENILNQIQRHRSKDDKGWLDCNYWRFLIRDCQDYNQAAEQYIGGAVNMRMHIYQPNKGEASTQFLRTGVMADMRNTWYSTKFLKKVQEVEGAERSQKIGEKAQEIIKRLEKAGVLPMDKGDESLILFEKDDLHGGFEKIIEYIDGRLQDQINSPDVKEKCQLQSAQRALKELHGIAQGEDVSIQQTIEKREHMLESQMLQMLQVQVAANVSRLDPSNSEKPFRMGYVTFVNCHSAKLDKTGWMHDENVELEDMAEIFRKFNGKELVFEKIDGAFIDEEGRIHLPAPDSDLVGENPPRKLETLFMAVTPQNNTRNDGTQKEVNEAAKGQLKVLHQSLLPGNDSKKKSRRVNC